MQNGPIKQLKAPEIKISHSMGFGTEHLYFMVLIQSNQICTRTTNLIFHEMFPNNRSKFNHSYSELLIDGLTQWPLQNMAVFSNVILDTKLPQCCIATLDLEVFIAIMPTVTVYPIKNGLFYALWLWCSSLWIHIYSPIFFMVASMPLGWWQVHSASEVTLKYKGENNLQRTIKKHKSCALLLRCTILGTEPLELQT